MELESWALILIILWSAMIFYGIYRKRYLLVTIFVTLEIAVVLFSYFYDNRDYRMHFAVFGTIALYLNSLIFLLTLLLIKPIKRQKSELED
ncbi:hypothetical protein ERX46_04695 [Brumimicrobium glaciale]|uniref:Uncharacterized protein n=1 Tax=Brumimicrobium glaciale TaxID=200475 RepID=A0A4Q4KPB1_9FLAO|nr:hypothetical protein [Brumimicrobium glaciale]RYM34677.1 hypothetical protein ERX46_04695 [Brumimicrobium glaciale]